MTKYLQLRISVEPSIVGVTNGGCQGWIDEKKYPKKDYLELVTCNDYNVFKSLIKKNETFISLLDKSKITDVIYFGPFLRYCPFMARTPFFETISHFNIDDYFLTDATVNKKGVELVEQYKLFCLSYINKDWIDFKQTTASLNGQITEDKLLHLESYDQYRNSLEKHPLLGLVTVYLNSKFDQSLDLFRLPIGGGGIFISERLATSLFEDRQYSGIELVDHGTQVYCTSK
ncbi:hypothetical protein [Mucilaginibacter defluvii]|uniref:Uncharacterized protein n=1 Tax=Mucilaginibacter defluvii TaxID=1196019 RepID=A0ABP9FK22_9SPHI